MQKERRLIPIDDRLYGESLLYSEQQTENQMRDKEKTLQKEKAQEEMPSNLSSSSTTLPPIKTNAMLLLPL
ncbi:hypothetical protein K0T92_04670 [Paenibacillus oenotherae]|uniref:Uncharacterized protein n=1 Tax=Paenibacillus oenotherae TaxID=1435645 RepID=A0ABS7D2K0_9BACL|nr:hypothetical protein [Paenibacillus oenotherae]MBW7474026.1 hypothetical protein [Paenibacillus oenotherae]